MKSIFLKFVCMMIIVLKCGCIAGESSRRLLRSGLRSVLMEAPPTKTFDASISKACYDHDPQCSSRMSNAVITEDDLNLLARVVERYNAGSIGDQRFIDEMCTTGNALSEMLKTFKCAESMYDLIQEVVPDINTLDLDTSTRPIDRAVVFVRDLLERVPRIRDSQVLNEEVFVMSFASVIQKLFHGIVPYVKNAYELADLFRVLVNRITRPGFVLFRRDTQDRSGRVLYPISGLSSKVHKILIFSTGAQNEPDIQEYHTALNALISGRSDLIAPYLSFDDIQEIYGDGDFTSL